MDIIERAAVDAGERIKDLQLQIVVHDAFGMFLVNVPVKSVHELL